MPRFWSRKSKKMFSPENRTNLLCFLNSPNRFHQQNFAPKESVYFQKLLLISSSSRTCHLLWTIFHCDEVHFTFSWSIKSEEAAPCTDYARSYIYLLTKSGLGRYGGTASPRKKGLMRAGPYGHQIEAEWYRTLNVGGPFQADESIFQKSILASKHL